MTLYESIELGLFLTFVIVKCVGKWKKWIDEDIKQMERKLDDLELCSERHRKGSGPIITGQFNTLLRPGLIETLNPWEERVVEGQTYWIKVDPAVEIYDDEYWRAFKRKHKHEDDEG